MKNLRNMDKLLLFITLALCIFGLVMIFSASSVSTILRYHVSSTHFFKKQLEAIILAFVIGIFIINIPTSKYKVFAYIGMAGIIGLLLLVLINGKISGGAASWLKVGTSSLQPSEFAKIILIIFMAVTYGGFSKYNNLRFHVYFIPIALAVLVCILIAMQPDFGSALITLAIAGLTFISVPMVSKNLKNVIRLGFVVLIVGALALSFSGSTILSSEQLSRFNYKKPCLRYSEDTGYQVCNGLIAIANGGLFGVGLGNSTQKYLYLPESHTDFIFPIICEELGSVVGSIVIIFYILLLARIYRIAKGADNLRTSMIAYGAFWYFTMHIFVNLFGILALIPLTGVPLPFLSYGGSYCLCSLIMIFIVERVAIENKKNKLVREMSKITN